MKLLRLMMIVAMCLGWIAVHAQQDVLIGTWKLNLAKSKLANPPKSQINKLEVVPNGVKFTLDVVHQDGSKTHQEHTAYFDNKFYPVKGDPNSDEVSRKRIDGRHHTQIRRKSGKIVGYSSSEASADGKTYIFRRIDANGKPVNDEFQVFDRQ